MNYGDILKKSFALTFKHPWLWLYGLFVVGTFNVNFVYLQGLEPEDLRQFLHQQHWLNFFSVHPGQLLVWTVGLLLASWIGIFLTNWARILLVLSTHKILSREPIEHRKLVLETRHTQWPVIGISLITTSLMVIVAAILLLPPLLSREVQKEILLWGTSLVTFLPLSFALSLINIFGAFYAILYRLNLGKALNLGTDFFITNWAAVLGLSVVLVIIYMSVFALGAGVNFLLRASLPVIAEPLGFLNVSAIILLLRGLSLLIFWLFLAILNVAFNTALLLIFLELQKPLNTAEKVRNPVASPAL